MASISTASGWMTNFIYEQDLTSAYMNNLFYSVFRPGVYNANAYFITAKGEDSTSGNADYLQLVIKKGTTLVFSNDYKKSTLTGYRRNWTLYNKDDNETIIKEQIPLLIKCTALKDMYFTIAKNYDSSNRNDQCLVKWPKKAGASESPDSRAPEVLYVTAFIRYNQNEDKDYALTPTFCLTRNNPFYGDTSLDTNPDSESSKFFYFHTNENFYKYSENGSEVYYWRLPDGSTHYGGEVDEEETDPTGHLDMMPQYSYLMLGALLDNNPWTNSSDKEYDQFSSDWMKYHTFTGRCLPEYRHSLIGNSNSESPDFIIPLKFNGSTDSTKFSRLYIDFKNIINYGSIFNTSIDWESAYGVTNNKSNIFPLLNGTEGTDYISYIMDNESFDKIENDKYWPVTRYNTIVMDFTFASTRTYFNISESDDTLPSSLFTKDSTIKLFNHREILYGNNDATIAAIVEELDCSKVHSDKLIGGTGLSGTQLCLDISDLNTFRLTDLITNNSLLPKVINKIRRDSKLDPANGESLIPVAIAFRAFSKIEIVFTATSDTSPVTGKTYYSGNETTGYTKVENPTTTSGLLEKVITASAADGITSMNSVNPANVLSMLDLNYRMTKLNPISSRTQDAYSIITVIK